MRTHHLAPILLLASAFQAPAALVLADHAIFGAGSLTFDTESRLQWLTPKTTVGRSYNETLALLAGDPSYAGFRVAILDELAGLYSAAGIPDVNVPGYGALYGTEANVPGVQYLQSLSGVTYAVHVAGLDLAETAGFVDAPFISPVNGFLSVHIGNVVHRLNVQTGNELTSFASAYTTWGSLPVGSNTIGVGTWLVSTLPEPSSMLLLLGSLAILTNSRRRAEA